MRALLLVLLLFFSPPRPLDMKVSPAVCFAPCAITVVLAIQPGDYRYALVEVDGPVFSSSTIPLPDVTAVKPAHYTFTYFRLPPGTYLIKAVLYDSTREVHRIMRQVIVNDSEVMKRTGL